LFHFGLDPREIAPQLIIKMAIEQKWIGTERGKAGLNRFGFFNSARAGIHTCKAGA